MELNFKRKHYFIDRDISKAIATDGESLQKQYLFLENNILSVYEKEIISKIINDKENTFDVVEKIAKKINIVIKNENMAAALILPNPPEEISEIFDEIYDIYADIAIAAEDNGFDLIILSGFFHLFHLKTALIAVKENTTIPTGVIFSDRKNDGGAIKAMVACASSIGADLIGFDVNGGYEKLCRILGECRTFTKVPFMITMDRHMDENSKDSSDKKFINTFKEMIENYGISVIGIHTQDSPSYIDMCNQSFAAIQDFHFGGISVSSISNASAVVNLNDFKIVGLPKISSKRFSPEEIISEALRLKSEGADIFFVPMEQLYIQTEEELIKVIKMLEFSVNLPLIIDTHNICLAESAMQIYNGKLGLYISCSDINDVKDFIDLAQRFGSALFINISGDDPKESQYNNYKKDYYIAGMMSDIWRLKKHLIYRDLILGMSVGIKEDAKSLKNIQAVLKRIHLNQNCTSFCNFLDTLEDGNDLYDKYSAFAGYVLDRGCTLFFAESGIPHLKKTIKLYREIFEI